MSRLYAWIDSDTNKQTKTITGNRMIEVKVNWGSRFNSKYGARLYIEWNKDEEKPRVYVGTSDKLETVINGVEKHVSD